MFDASSHDWRVSVSREWDVSSGTISNPCERAALSITFLSLNLSEPIDLNARYPSAYADGGDVGWTTVHSKGDGTLDVSFPNIRWSSLRDTEGWAALQHHAVLRTSITVYPPSTVEVASDPPHLLVDLLQGSFFAVVHSENNASTADWVVPEWFAGNIYALDRARPQSVSLPFAPSSSSPTTYDLFASGDYEIRLFGDPLHGGDHSGVPVLSIRLTVDIEADPTTDVAVLVPSHDVSCDFIDGWAFGEAIGVGVRSVSGWWTVQNVSLVSDIHNIKLSPVHDVRIAPTQTRVVPIRLIQNTSFHASEISLDLHLVSKTTSTTLRVKLPVKQHAQWTTVTSPPNGLKASYFYAQSIPTAFIVIPPEEPNDGEPRPPVLALHGAGVDILDMPFWIQALPRQRRSWIIAPTGRTAWGLDWHGPSAKDAWDSVDALRSILQRRDTWRAYTLAPHSRVLILGHSNGGQGAWYLASRYPDRVVAVVPAAGYIKSQAYVALSQSRSAHYIDPSVRAILESSLTPDDNDLFLSNLADTPILAIHGGDDENVPVWHTREAVSVLKTWNPQASVTLREDAGQPHWYSSVFDNAEVQGFIGNILDRESGAHHLQQYSISASFTLTVAIPAETGSMHGWRVHSLMIPGRLARLSVNMQGRAVHVRTTNIAVFSVEHLALNTEINIDGAPVSMKFTQAHSSAYFLYQDGSWRPVSVTDFTAQPSGRMSGILTTPAPVVLVVRDKWPHRALSFALRVAHNLDVYHKLDAEIIDDAEAVERLQTNELGRGNIIAIGGPDSSFIRSMLAQERTAFTFENGHLHLKGQRVASSAALFLHPHPASSSSLVLFICAHEVSSFERALRLIPLRTGVTTPDWMLLGEHADMVGAAGVEGTGVWGNNWSWNEAMSSF